MHKRSGSSFHSSNFAVQACQVKAITMMLSLSTLAHRKSNVEHTKLLLVHGKAIPMSLASPHSSDQR